MDQGSNRKLNSFHVVFLVQNVLIGVNLLSLPHDLIGVGSDMWWYPALLGPICWLTVLPMVWVCSRYPEDSLFRINEKLLGKWLGSSINLVFILYALATVAAVAEGYLRLMQTITMPDRTITGPLIFLLIVLVYIVEGGIKGIARFCIISFVFTGWLVYYLQWSLVQGDLRHLLPVFQAGGGQLLTTAHRGLPAFLGYELLLFCYPYIREPKKVFRNAGIGIALAVFFYVSVTVASVAYFSLWQLDHLLYPVLNLFKAVELSFLERVENLGISLWVFLILSTMAAYLWMAAKGVDTMMKKFRKAHLYIGALLVFAMIESPFKPEQRKDLYEEWIPLLGYGVILYPLLLLPLVLLRNRKEKNGNEPKQSPEQNAS